MVSGDRAGRSQWPDTISPSGVREQGKGALGLLRNVGDPAACSVTSRMDHRVNEVQACRDALDVRPERTKRAQLNYLQAKATKRGEMSVGKS
jgi:hypothetical protein